MPNREESLQEKDCREALIGSTVSGATTSHWGMPPLLMPEKFGERLRPPLPGLVRPSGGFAQWTGARISVVEQMDSDHIEYIGRDQAERVCAWHVPSLLNATLVVESPSEIASKVRRLLGRHVPGVDFWVPDFGWDGAFRKYGFVHQCLAAPPNELSGEAMSLELFAVGGTLLEHDDPRYKAMMSERRERNDPNADLPLRVQLPARLVVSAATYSNVLFPSIGVPCYM